jgi:Fe-Mn family superoxide dismutase
MDTHAPPVPVEPTSWRELAAASVGGDGAAMEPACQLMLEASFGGVDTWRAQFAVGAAAAGGAAGWMLLCFRPREGMLANQWVRGQEPPCEPPQEPLQEPPRSPAGGVPILALEMPGPVDGLGADQRIRAFLATIDWRLVYRRYQAAVRAASDGLAAGADDVARATVLDVRRAGAFAQAPAMIPGARWCDPAAVAGWASALPTDRPVLVYCVYGHEVSQATVLRLRAAGVDARYLSGGIEDWRASGRPLAEDSK